MPAPVNAEYNDWGLCSLADRTEVLHQPDDDFALGVVDYDPLVEPDDCPTPTPTPAAQQIVWGDNNRSGSADPVESLLTLRLDAGLSVNTGSCPEMGQVVDVQNASPHPWGDVDCGGDVTPVDSLKLLRYDAGLSVAQAAGCPQTGSQVTLAE